jgi:hypothetical protein
MVSVRNVALFGADWLGAKAMESYHLEFSTLAIANGLISLIALPLVFLLPGFIMDHADAGGGGIPREPGGAHMDPL